MHIRRTTNLTSSADIRAKFEELEWQQRLRMSDGARDQTSQWALENNPLIKSRNRYTNVQAFANLRIHLKVPEGQCDFINASPITLNDSLTGTKARYIATQGPKSDQASHFWHMVFHETSQAIDTQPAIVIMLTQTAESGREKCAQYFPLDSSNPTMDLTTTEGTDDPFTDPTPGTVTLLNSSFDEASRSEVRELALKIGTTTKTVWHFLFAGWADYSKPEGRDREALLELLKLTATKAGSLNNPRIVHCSAGVGRTGTFVALDYLLRELESGGLVRGRGSEDIVFETVNLLRQQRMMMVYNEMQLQFIYEVLREQFETKYRASSGNDTPRERSPKVRRVSAAEGMGAETRNDAEPKSGEETGKTVAASGNETPYQASRGLEFIEVGKTNVRIAAVTETQD